MKKIVGTVVIIVAAVFIFVLFKDHKTHSEDPHIVSSLETHHSHSHSHSHFSKEGQSPSKVASPKDIQSFEEKFRKAYPGDWKFQKTDSGGVFRMTSVKDGRLQIKTDQDLVAFAQQFAEMMGMEHFEQSRVDTQAARKTKFSVTQVVAQKYKQFDVLDGSLQITKTGDGNDVYSIENLLQPVSDSPNLEVNIDREQAQKKLHAHFAHQGVSQVKSLSQTPQLDTRRLPQELVWVFLTVVSDYSAYRVFVGAASGEITSESIERH